MAPFAAIIMARGYKDYTLIEEFKEQLRANEFVNFIDRCIRTADLIRQEENKPIR